MTLTQTRLKEVLNYDSETGVFTWRVAVCNRACGETAGGFNPDRYLQIGVDNKRYKAHRLAWLYVYGHFPADEIDHIDHNPANNRISNLREATHNENHRNTTRHKGNTSGITGVCWHKQHRKWRAHIMIDRISIHLGYFLCISDAVAARNQANLKYGFHENHGTPKA